MTTMNTPKHTPLNKAVHAIPMLYAEAFAGSNNKEFVVELYSDARLLETAAPAMYEALQWAMQYLRMPNFHPDNSYNSEQWARDYNKLTDALAQADGEGILP